MQIQNLLIETEVWRCLLTNFARSNSFTTNYVNKNEFTLLTGYWEFPYQKTKLWLLKNVPWNNEKITSWFIDVSNGNDKYGDSVSHIQTPNAPFSFKSSILFFILWDNIRSVTIHLLKDDHSEVEEKQQNIQT